MHITGLVVFVCFSVAFINAQASCPTYTCQSALGGKCNDTVQCGKGQYCSMSDNTCTKYIAIGDSCSSKYECVGGDIQNSDCRDGKCVAVTWSGKVGENCTFWEQCTTDLYCNTSSLFQRVGTCVPLASSRDACGYGINDCKAGYACNNGACVLAYSVQEGGMCSVNGNIFSTPSFICAAGLYCKANRTVTGICTKGFASSGAPCNTTCENSEEYCFCGSGAKVKKCQAPVIATASQPNEWIALQKCAEKENCNILDPACCHGNQCIFYDFVYQHAVFPCDNPFAFCNKKGEPTGILNRNAMIGIIAGAVVGVTIVLGLIIFFVRRRSANVTHAYRVVNSDLDEN